MPHRFILPLVLAISCIAGCATPYQPFELFGRGGYQERKISEDVYQVTYYGNHVTSMETLNALLLYRSAELTLNNGYDYFEVLKGYARMPLSALGGFRMTEHTIKMHKGEPTKQEANIYEARKIIHDFGPSIKANQ